MKINQTLLALGRSRYLYDSIIYLSKQGYKFKAIITDIAYDEYDIKPNDFQILANQIGAKYFLEKNLQHPEIIEFIQNENINIGISVNWRYKIPKDFLNLVEFGIFNFHLGSLPDYKGNATLNWAIINGENYIYGNIHKMDAELDAGDIIARTKFTISPDTYIADVLQLAESSTPQLFEKALIKLSTNPQYYEMKGTEKGLRCYPRLPQDSQIDWFDSVSDIQKLIRASSEPFHGAYTYLNNKKVIIWRANIIYPSNPYSAVPGHIIEISKQNGSVFVACIDGFLEITDIQYQHERMSPANLIKSIRVRFKRIENESD